MSALPPAAGFSRKGTPDPFALVGAGYAPPHTSPRAGAPAKAGAKHLRGIPVAALVVLALIMLGCLCAELISNHDPAEFYLMNRNQAPNAEFWFGTDSLGRDLYSLIWHGGRTSLAIGFVSAAVAAVIGVAFGCAAGMASAWADHAMMRLAELLQSIPVLLSLLLICSLTGEQSPLSLALIIGGTGWFALARIVRSEVRQISDSEYVLAAQCMGASYPHIMRRHLIPNFVSSVMFVIVSGVSTSIAMESTLSFLGLGLPVEMLSWGSMLALADRALLLNTWWVIVIPGVFLIVTLLCVTSLGHSLRKAVNQGPNNL